MGNNLTPRQEQFVYKHTLEGKPAGVAYAEAYERKVDDTAYNNASRLLRNARIQERIEDLREVYLRDSFWAYGEQKKLAEDTKTPAHVRNAILSEIQDRAGYKAPQKLEHREEPHFPGLSDITKEDLLAMVHKLPD